jgi:zinc/manganese transport system substrate-binding protein
MLGLLALASVSGCGGEEEPAAGGERPDVVATSGFAADIAAAVAGDDAEVLQLVPDAASPHSYSPSARDRARLAEADLVVAIGGGYEEALGLEQARVPVFAIADHVGELRRFGEDEVAKREHAQEGEEHAQEGEEHAQEGEEHAQEGEEHAQEGEEHGAGAPDPHVWMDPTRVAAAAPALADALARVDPGGDAGYDARASAFARRLERLDRELRETLAVIPAARRKLVTSHESLGWFADRYDLEFVGAPFGVQPEAEASAGRVAEVIETVRRERVPVVFAQEGDDPKVMRQIAQEAGVRVVDDLLVENPGPQASGYEEALRFDARRIADALGA